MAVGTLTSRLPPFSMLSLPLFLGYAAPGAATWGLTHNLTAEKVRKRLPRVAQVLQCPRPRPRQQTVLPVPVCH